MPTFATDIINVMTSTTVTFASDFITNYWAYLLAFGIITFIARRMFGLGRGGL
jgi:hypothetical protein